MSRQKALTRNQFLVLDVLKEGGTPLSAYDILDRLRDEGLKAPLQIYRALGALIRRGHAHRLESLNAFVACNAEQCNHTGVAAFAICQNCGQASEFSDFVLRQRLEAWAEREGFRTSRAVVEMHGTCVVCTLSGQARDQSL